MKNKLLPWVIFTFSCGLPGFSQNTFELTFSAGINGQTMISDSILIRNITQNDEVTLYYPDNTLSLVITNTVEIQIPSNLSFELSEISPNPVNDEGIVNLGIPEKGLVEVSVSDISGWETDNCKKYLEAGNHSFLVRPGNSSVYLITASYQGQTKTTKMIAWHRNPKGNCCISYNGLADLKMQVKSTGLYTELAFQPGDELLMVGYSGSAESGLADSPVESRDYYFEFATNIACPGVDSLLYEGQWYHTIQVFGQCWMKENLNVGVRIPGSGLQTNNGVVEKYCYGNSDAMCATYGGLYIWDEMMQYSQEPRSQGICPGGWHIPTDAEISILEGGVDSYYPIGDPVWNTMALRGYDCGKNLKSTSGWINNGNGTDAFGMTILPTGYWYENGFFDIGDGCTLFSSDIMEENPVYRGFSFGTIKIIRNLSVWQVGSPVRCLKNL